MLCLEPVERRIQRAPRNRTCRPPFDFFADRHCVGIVFEPQDGEQDNLLELAEVGITHAGAAPVSTMPALQALYARVQLPVPAVGSTTSISMGRTGGGGQKKPPAFPPAVSYSEGAVVTTSPLEGGSYRLL